jgi:hypothetical protein
MSAAKAAWKAQNRAERQHAREHGWPTAPMNDQDPVTNLIFFEQDEDTGNWSVFDILQFTLTAEEAVQVMRTWRGFEGRPYIIERGFFMGGTSFFPVHHCVNRAVSRGRAPFPR